MAPRPGSHRRIASGLGLLLIAWLGLIGPGRADSPVYYFAERTFEIPYSTPGELAFSRIHLHASNDTGKTYSAVGSTNERSGAFTYTAREDGWYFFVVQIERKDGSLTPARPALAEPTMRVCVDTEKPRATMWAVAPQKGHTVAVEWGVTDKFLDLQTLRLDYRALNGTRWLPLDNKQTAKAQFEWTPPGAGPFEVRLRVRDKGGLEAEAKCEVRPIAAAPGGGFPRAGAETGDSPPPGGGRVEYVNRKTFKLNYTIGGEGPSRTRHVDVWMTTNSGSSWTLHSKAATTGPHEVTVTRQGRYGFTLRPISGVGRGSPPPQAGDLPMIWVEVDETAPVVKLHNVVVNEGADAHTITVNWQASDKFLGDKPITILYAPTAGPDAKWEVLQAGVENTGSHKCQTNGLPFEFFVRVEATDLAKNKAWDQTRETVKVDLSEPKVTELNVTIGDQSNKPPK